MKLNKAEQQVIDLIASRGGWCWRSIIDCDIERPDTVLRSLQSKKLIRQATRDDRVGAKLTTEGQKLLQRSNEH